jgi:lysophospholipase L1-like esterase
MISIRLFSTILAAGVVALAPSAGLADSYQSSPPRQTAAPKDWGPWLGPFRESLVPKLMEDFGEQYLYAPANAALAQPKAGEARVVFLGDSITDRWNLQQDFPGRPYVNRGIGSQITPQMLLRFHADVVALKPRVVVILAGVNDVHGVLQVETLDQIKANFTAMFEIARANGVAVVFSSVLPVNNYTDNARTVLAERHPDELRALNAWLLNYAATHGAQFADYYPVLADAKGLMRADFTNDGIHPTAAAYKVMAPIAQGAIDRALAGPR